MCIENNNVKKLCSFYVSDWHLVAMLLPYINQKINEREIGRASCRERV